ncbi:hypothetical protein B0H14DRAFT_3125885 [Mycena olivaceomarginata]|nr:hypothetical protein B0H14DRAFT_3125885 [Mycena olivaceomarginata]
MAGVRNAPKWKQHYELGREDILHRMRRLWTSVRPRPKALTPKALDFFDPETRPWPSLGLSRVAIMSLRHRGDFSLSRASRGMPRNAGASNYQKGTGYESKSMYFTYCKACVTEELKKRGATATTLQTFKTLMRKACAAGGSTQGEKSAWIAHILGGRTPCLYASAEATAEATLQRITKARAN